ncbi:NUDIX domain-containing protein [Nonomuraea sp. NPDC004580]|uniref:NUDIX domain-containing protein n=1 Tax=Nonomuraea sp. NPDC004580 TaxID=3154552 RepID=UPI00339FF59C
MCVQFAQKAVIEWQGRLLLIKKSGEDPHQPGRWELPGGRMKTSDQSPDEALVREIREEVGLEVRPGRPLALWSWQLDGEQTPTVVAVARLCTASDDRVDMSGNDKQDFIEKYGWFEREEVLGLNLIPSARDAIETVLASL